jgi:phosphopantetheinyl transferase (holo-ACP synthase)
MIGIDLTRISRFEKIDLVRLGKKLGHELKSTKEAAKIWACLEALTKAEGKRFDPKKIQIVFKTGCAPIAKPFPKAVQDDPVALDFEEELSGEYVLSLTHEGDYIAVVAIKRDNK